jgi:hypothetical protein
MAESEPDQQKQATEYFEKSATALPFATAAIPARNLSSLG